MTISIFVKRVGAGGQLLTLRSKLPQIGKIWKIRNEMSELYRPSADFVSKTCGERVQFFYISLCEKVILRSTLRGK